MLSMSVGSNLHIQSLPQIDKRWILLNCRENLISLPPQILDPTAWLF